MATSTNALGKKKYREPLNIPDSLKASLEVSVIGGTKATSGMQAHNTHNAVISRAAMPPLPSLANPSPQRPLPHHRDRNDELTLARFSGAMIDRPMTAPPAPPAPASMAAASSSGSREVPRLPRNRLMSTASRNFPTRLLPPLGCHPTQYHIEDPHKAMTKFHVYTMEVPKGSLMGSRTETQKYSSLVGEITDKNGRFPDMTEQGAADNLQAQWMVYAAIKYLINHNEVPRIAWTPARIVVCTLLQYESDLILKLLPAKRVDGANIAVKPLVGPSTNVEQRIDRSRVLAWNTSTLPALEKSGYQVVNENGVFTASILDPDLARIPRIPRIRR
ncbi:hypothetical protein HWV62_12892 [Athelia sp. TMB]|nr:hypothetical protein HWV62_21698 [Athelia sp. TMB]KAF7984648.1 hypothetical protein HWV62_12892 [Athelia sp. TMB]